MNRGAKRHEVAHKKKQKQRETHVISIDRCCEGKTTDKHKELLFLLYTHVSVLSSVARTRQITNQDSFCLICVNSIACRSSSFFFFYLLGD